MASIEIRSFKMSLVLVNGLVMLLSVLVAVEDVFLLPFVPAPTHDYLEQCGVKLRPKCGEDINTAVFITEKVSDKCYSDFLAEGRAYHDKFVEVIAPYYPKLAHSEAPAMGAQVWNDCAAALPLN